LFAGKDVGCHPENSSRQCAAPKPTRSELLCNKNIECVPENFVDSEIKKPKRHLIHEKRDDGDKEDKDELMQTEAKVRRFLLFGNTLSQFQCIRQSRVKKMLIFNVVNTVCLAARRFGGAG